MPVWPTPIELAGPPPTIVKPAPDAVAEVTFTVAVPVFVTVKVCEALVPSETFPKTRLAALGVRIPAPGVPGFPPAGLLALV